FSDIAVRFLETNGYEAVECNSEEEARKRVPELMKQKKWPCYFFRSDTTGEKNFEEFYMAHEQLDLDKFKDIGIVKSELKFESERLDLFESQIEGFKKQGNWSKENLVSLFKEVLPEFRHEEKGKYLDNKM